MLGAASSGSSSNSSSSSGGGGGGGGGCSSTGWLQNTIYWFSQLECKIFIMWIKLPGMGFIAIW